MKMKTISKLILVSGLTLSMTANTFAAITLTVDGSVSTVQTEPMIQNGRTLVAVNDILPKLGATMEWDSSTRIVTATDGNNTLIIPIDSSIAYVNGKAVELDIPAQIINGRTMVPLRFIGEAFDKTVEWNETDNTIIITSRFAAEQEEIVETETAPARTAEGMRVVNSSTSVLPKYDETLTLSKAYDEALKNNKSIKDLKRNIEDLEDSRKTASNTLMNSIYAGSTNLNSIVTVKTIDLSLSNATYSEVMIKEGIEASLMSYFATIQTYERNIALLQASIQLSEKQLSITKTKLDLGLESQLNYDNAVIELEQQKKNLDNLQTQLETEYISLNNFLGRKADSRYHVEYEAVFESIEDVDIDYHIAKITANDPYLITQYQAVQEAQTNLNLFTTGNSTYESARISLESANSNYKETKQNYEKSIRNMYNSLLVLESNRNSLLLDLEKAKLDYETALLNYELDQITEIAVEAARLNILSAETELETNLTNHALSKYSFEHPYLSGGN